MSRQMRRSIRTKKFYKIHPTYRAFKTTSCQTHWITKYFFTVCGRRMGKKLIEHLISYIRQRRFSWLNCFMQVPTYLVIVCLFSWQPHSWRCTPKLCFQLFHLLIEFLVKKCKKYDTNKKRERTVKKHKIGSPMIRIAPFLTEIPEISDSFIRFRDKNCSYPSSLLEIIYITFIFFVFRHAMIEKKDDEDRFTSWERIKKSDRIHDHSTLSPRSSST
jgi:hypothetical protein